MSNLFTFEGRINRAKYFGYSLLISFILMFLLHVTEYTENTFLVYIYIISAIIASIINICLIIKRLHDIERAGTHYFLLIIPIYNIYLHLLLLLKKGTDGPNQYGEDPLREMY
ncbi:DUF805 domain-containing protein [Tepidibacter aestuarii]|uniref:DUF805 domain-containing protein n=1 Tax=Tepidibacter aestuarii TaxID=2925782 RepID=UPI0020C179BF|nr:DUF805 domain-containing protein [Tepidibacter aestuarii]CAH2213611.1 Uncharacterized membrane protein YhaH, DUF805 family [Tepidibacter aestuarii]